MAVQAHGQALYCTICKDHIFKPLFPVTEKEVAGIAASHDVDLHPEEIERTGSLTDPQMSTLMEFDRSYRLFVVKYCGGAPE